MSSSQSPSTPTDRPSSPYSSRRFVLRINVSGSINDRLERIRAWFTRGSLRWYSVYWKENSHHVILLHFKWPRTLASLMKYFEADIGELLHYDRPWSDVESGYSHMANIFGNGSQPRDFSRGRPWILPPYVPL